MATYRQCDNCGCRTTDGPDWACDVCGLFGRGGGWFDIASGAGRYYSLDALKGLWRLRYRRSMLQNLTRTDYNRQGYALLADRAWMRSRTGYVPQALLEEVERHIITKTARDGRGD